MKTNKSYSKRIKVTKNGKLVARKPGQNHFNARQTGQQRLRRKRTQLLAMSNKAMSRFLPGNGGKKAKAQAASDQNASNTDA